MEASVYFTLPGSQLARVRSYEAKIWAGPQKDGIKEKGLIGDHQCDMPA